MIRVDKRNFAKTGEFTNHRVISEYSVTIGRDVINDRSNARYLVVDNIRDGVHFDLSLGLETFRDKVFVGAEFAFWRGTMKRMAITLASYNPRKESAWTIVAQDFGGVILISEPSKEYKSSPNDLATYSGFKFEQYMTSDEPDGSPDTVLPVDNRPTFEIMVRTDLKVGRETLKLCCGAEVDALRGGEPIEFKTAWEGRDNGFFRNISNVIQSEIVGVKSIVTGIKRGEISKGEILVYKVVEKQVRDIKADRNIKETTSQCYSFLFTVLSEVKNFLKHNEACEVSFNPFRGEVKFKRISRQEAKESGNGVTDEFISHFKL